MALEIAFWVLATVAIASALAVVTLRNVFRAALSLILCFLAVAGIFITLGADFLAAVQIFIYIGAISILIILAIMLTREVQRGSLSNRLVVPVLISAILFFGTVTFAMLNTSWPLVSLPPAEATTAALAGKLFGEDGYILAVEIAAILLLATIIGAITIVKEK
jgi:NADH-quinone oxidoreductase subunit J